MGLRMKKFNIIGVHWKIQIFKGVGFTKNQYTGGKLPKKEGGGGGELGQFAELRGAGPVFLRGGLIPKY